MKLVKGLQKWIDGYQEVKTLSDELELSFDFYKDELKHASSTSRRVAPP